MIQNKIIKQRFFSIAATNFEEIKQAISQQEGIESASINNNGLTISYDLKLNNYAGLKNYLSSITTLKKETLFSKLRTSYIVFYERNEINHMNSQTGWNYYIQNVYLSLQQEL